MLRYLGNKDSIVEEINKLLKQKELLNKSLVFFDAFCGTGSVSDYIKNDFDLIINDNLKWSVVYSHGRLVALKCKFEMLGFDPFEYLNKDKTGIEGFIYKNYSPSETERMYFTTENAMKIDYFRLQIEEWFTQERINYDEYTYLLASLIESVSRVSNTAGVYGAFLKKWDSRALKPIEFLPVVSSNTLPNKIICHNDKVENIIEEVDCDILYLDPPYTQNQYGTQYHLLETLVLMDSPSVSKVTGSRPTGPMRSDWSKSYKVHILFDKIIATTKAKYIIFSYSSTGIMSKDFIEASLKRYGKVETYVCKKIPYKKYQNWKSENKEENFEYLFFIEKKPVDQVKYESPLNYIGSKSKMINDLTKHMPEDASSFVDLFGGGFNVGINSSSDKVIYNEINFFVRDVIKSFSQNDTYDYIMYINRTIKKYDLEPSKSESYLKVREYYNSLSIEQRDPKLLYTIIMYGFQQQIRFNSSFGFNNPVGMRWFNNKVLEKMVSFSRRIKEMDVNFLSKDFEDLEIHKDMFVYMDPPYRLTTGSYNDGKRGFRGWGLDEEIRFFSFVDNLNNNDIKFMISYVRGHNGETNYQLENWLNKNKYSVIELSEIPGRKRSEVLIINYDHYSGKIHNSE